MKTAKYRAYNYHFYSLVSLFEPQPWLGQVYDSFRQLNHIQILEYHSLSKLVTGATGMLLEHPDPTMPTTSRALPYLVEIKSNHVLYAF